jgi:hypothetical protein
MSKSSYAFQYKDLDLKMTGKIAETYDDNIEFEEANEKEDYITTLSLGLNATYEGRRRGLEMSGLINHRFNAKNSDIENSSESFALKSQNAFSAYDRMILNYNFTHSHSPASFDEAFGRENPRRESYRHNFNVKYSKDMSESLIINTKYAYNLTTFSGDTKDTYSHRVGFNINYLQSAATTYLVSYYYAENKFDNQTHTPTVGMKQHITRRLYLNGQAGLDIRKSSNGDKDTGLHTDISLTNEIDELSSARFLFASDERFSSEGGDVFSSWRTTGQYQRHLLNKLIGIFVIYYGEGTYSDSDIKDTFTGGNIDFNYLFSETLSGGVRYVYANNDSDDESREYTKNIITISLNKTFK